MFGPLYLFFAHPTVRLSSSSLALPGLLLGLSTPLAAQTAQTTSPPTETPAKPRQAVKLGVFSNETVGASYERQWGRYSLQTTLGYWTNGFHGGGAYYVSDSAIYQIRPSYTGRWHQVGLTVQLRRYLQASKPALVGWYAAGGLQLLGQWTRYRYDNGQPTDREFSHAQALHLRLGRQCQLGPRFTFDFHFGPEVDMRIRRLYEYNPSTGVYSRTGPRYFGADLTAGMSLQVGYRL